MTERPPERDVADLVAHLAGRRRGSSPPPPVAPAPDAPVVLTPAMVATATREQLDAWKDGLSWEDDAFGWIQDREAELDEQDSAAPPQPANTAPAVAPPQPAVADPRPAPTPRESFEASLANVLPKRAIMGLYDNDPALAAAVRDQFSPAENPRIPEALLVQLQEAGLLWLSWEVGRVSAGESNSMIYQFHLARNGGGFVGEWHVHWESRGRAGNPGWKIGYDGAKSGGDDVQLMRRLIGSSQWGSIRGYGGTPVLAGS